MSNQHEISVLSAALVNAEYDGKNPLTVAPEIDHPNIRLAQLALKGDWYVYGTDYNTILFNKDDGAMQIDPKAQGNEGIVGIYYYALLNVSMENQGPTPTPDGLGTSPGGKLITFGRGDGEYNDHFGEYLSGAVISALWVHELPAGGGTMMQPPGERQLTNLPINAMMENPGYVAELDAIDGCGILHLSVYAYNDMPQLQESVIIHVFGTGSQAGQLLGVMTAEQNTDVYVPVLSGGVVLVAMIRPLYTIAEGGTEVYTFEIGDPEKDGVIRITRV